ncbi:polysaccharide deacetylase family protein [Octadecabacter sp. 1_MG-2023]|uniref:polysaccharide deacetylase family protein n=1 Tax=unclassified Octadecabacter TaxID=196158 RepID=UPI001C09F10B|nr:MULTISPECIES: polysaccharide deacetylase family protein [unclassified Octadecabacter]MBU2992119.1 polysaccharide deacetylase family protein [Octadecabacter sp. B2R22]MDO6735125.1 polysaccharide deacetylase family protein [Octadecabacter sp. 1_MG-2023]
MWRLAVIITVLILCAWGALQLSRSTTFMIAGEAIARVETTAPVIAITFDDGPSPRYLGDVLTTLNEHDAIATFFLVGQDVVTHPELVTQIANDGHELGNHSYSHPRLVLMSPSRVAAEIEATDQALRNAGYTGAIPFRPPYGKKLVVLPFYLSRNERPAIMWDVAPEGDPALAGDADAITDFVLQEARSGSIILLHPMYDSGSAARAALPAILSGLSARGFEFVTVSELLELRAP